jgi:hypothetical protein
MKAVYLTFGAALFVLGFLGLPTPAFESGAVPPPATVTPRLAAVPPAPMPTMPLAGPRAPMVNPLLSQIPNTTEVQRLAMLVNMIRLQSFALSNRIHVVGRSNRLTFFAGLRNTHIRTSTARR